MKHLALVLALVLFGCASPRSNAIFGLKFSEQPPRAVIRAECNGEKFTTQGVLVCEQKSPTVASVSVKVLPLEGRVVYSNGQLKMTEDFNWYPKEGFWIWKRKPIKDTWIDLDLGEINSAFGDWPVALDVMAISKVGVINTRGILYHRLCNDKDIPCSKLVVSYECGGRLVKTGEGKIGKCVRLSGSAQAFTVDLKSPTYDVKLGAKLYVMAPRSNFAQALDISPEELTLGVKKFEIPMIESGPTLVGFRVVWFEAGVRTAAETRVLLVGSDPAWTGLDQPHYMAGRGGLEIVRPVLGDLLEANLYNGQSVEKTVFGDAKSLTLPTPRGDQVACGYAWQRDSSDLSVLCLDANLNEVKIP